MLNKVKLFLSISDDSKDELLEAIKDICEAKILNYIQLEILPRELEGVLLELIILRYNKLNSEGFNSESIEGSSVSYIGDIFELVKDELDLYILKRDNRKKRGISFI